METIAASLAFSSRIPRVVTIGTGNPHSDSAEASFSHDALTPRENRFSLQTIYNCSRIPKTAAREIFSPSSFFFGSRQRKGEHTVPKYLTIGEAAEVLRLTEKAVRMRISRGELPYRKVGRSVRIPTLELERFMNRLTGLSADEALSRISERGS
jgi:excisionase family DNA binding protein